MRNERALQVRHLRLRARYPEELILPTMLVTLVAWLADLCEAAPVTSVTAYLRRTSLPDAEIRP